MERSVTDDVTPRFKAEKPERSETANQRRGRINRQKGKRKQAAARRVFEDIYGVQASWQGKKGNEETWDHITACRLEVKAGAQVGPLATRYLAAEKQSEAARAYGDVRPFVFVAMPDQWGSEGLFVCRLSVLKELLG
jgi:hypothetical protein